MRLMEVAFKRETAVPMLALILASVVSVGLILARVIWTGELFYAGLVWNLFLAWLPLVFALLARDEFRPGTTRTWRFLGFAGAWLLFFPNAPYIFTDITHLTTYLYGRFWVDLVLILTCAMTGLVLGFVSLFLMQGVVRRLFGSVASWFFIGGVAGLSSFGIYLGRFLRFNSWDIIRHPLALSRGIGHWAANPMAQSASFAFPMLFAVFLFLAYLMLYALTHLKPTEAWDRLAPKPSFPREPAPLAQPTRR
jgi:uncharacterized membrane protein